MIICLPIPLHQLTLGSLPTTRPLPTPMLLIQTSWPRATLRNITTEPATPPALDTVLWRERSMPGMHHHVLHQYFMFLSLSPPHFFSVTQAQAPLRSSRAYSVYIEDDRDRDRQSVSRFSAVPESRSYRLVLSDGVTWVLCSHVLSLPCNPNYIISSQILQYI